MRPTLLLVVIIGLLIIAPAAATTTMAYAQTTNTTTTNTNTNTTMPSDQEVEAEIAQASPNPDYDTLVNQGIDNCMDWLQMGNNPYEVACDAPAMTEEKNLDCEIYENQLLLCNPNGKLAQKFYAYLNMTTAQ